MEYKYMLLIGSIALIAGLLKFIWQDIKKDPITNLVMPVATALLTNLLLWLLEMRQ